MQNDSNCTITKFGRPALRATYPDENAMPETMVMICEATSLLSASAHRQFSPNVVENAVAPMKYSRSQAFTCAKSSLERSARR